MYQTECRWLDPTQQSGAIKQLFNGLVTFDGKYLARPHERGSNKGTGLVSSYTDIPASPIIAPTAYTISDWFESYPPIAGPNATQVVSTYKSTLWTVDAMPAYAGFETFTTATLATMASTVATEMNKDTCMQAIKHHFVGRTLDLDEEMYYGKTQVVNAEYVWKNDVDMTPFGLRAFKKGDHFVYTDDVYVSEVVDSSTGGFTGTKIAYADHSNMYRDPLDPYPNEEKLYVVKYKCDQNDVTGDVTLHYMTLADDYSCFHQKDRPSPWDKGTSEATVSKTRRDYTYWVSPGGNRLNGAIQACTFTNITRIPPLVCSPT